MSISGVKPIRPLLNSIGKERQPVQPESFQAYGRSRSFRQNLSIMKATSSINLFQTSRILHLLIAAAVVFVVYFLLEPYFERVLAGKHEDQVALLAGVYFVGGIYLGRTFSQLLTVNQTRIPNRQLIILLILILFCCIALLLINTLPSFLNLVIFITPFTALSILVGMFVKHIRTAITLQLKDAQVSAEQSQSELQLLQSQLSPHFLFNTLNNLYGLSLTDHEKVPPLLLKLSDLLRYSVYETKVLWVPLVDELSYLDNYIAFEKIRLGDRLNLRVQWESIHDPSVQIAPMLLIVFVENAFKHSKNTVESKITIEIELKRWADSILFSVRNSYEKLEAQTLNKNSGLGLENARKRLELLYPGEHTLTINAQPTFYQVLLQLKKK
ncbi:hypothetical protein BWI93_02290 [Siphonobacter sp. BAB-5385]|nr:hypothetical protein BWI93_02290 [Siphonobacter sp. BAB-5385]